MLNSVYFVLAAASVVVSAQESSGLNPLTKDVAQVLSWVAAVVVGALAVWKAVGESRQNREQRERTLESAKADRQQREQELRWRRAQTGSGLVDRMLSDRLATDAMQMTDWSGRSYTLSDGTIGTIGQDDVIRGLRATRGGFGPKEAFVRDAFDALFLHLVRFEQAIAIDLTTLDDVRVPVDYYIIQMCHAKEIFAGYMTAFGHDLALKFCQRITGDWNT